MNLSQRIIALIGMLGVGAVAASSPASALNSEDLELAQRACDRALQENTIEALEEYLRLYPRAPTSCRVLALEALGGFGPSDGDGPNPGNPGNTGNYGA